MKLTGMVFWAVASLIWQLIIRFLLFGPATIFPISNAARLIIITALLLIYFYPQLSYGEKYTKVYFFDYPIPLPSWQFFAKLSLTALGLYWASSFFITWETYPLIKSLVFTVIAAPFFEELIARSLFIKYRMTPLQFIFFNTLSAASFALMHIGLTAAIPSLYTLLFEKGHFIFGFMLGIIAYKTQRLETAILLHMSSNTLRYLIPVTLFGRQLAPIQTLETIIELLVLAFATHKTLNMHSGRSKPIDENSQLP